ncbi:MAG: hypothetical protein SYR96_22485 [Actinomycetota bacterium]|nr:hypothetical protein [Actinomycetota bacterium]
MTAPPAVQRPRLQSLTRTRDGPPLARIDPEQALDDRLERTGVAERGRRGLAHGQHGGEQVTPVER